MLSNPTGGPFQGYHLIAGFDASGIVEAIDESMTLFKVGDQVMFAGSMIRQGCPARITGKKPSNVSFSQAVAFPLTSLTAWEGLVVRLGIPTDPAKNERKTILV